MSFNGFISVDYKSNPVDIPDTFLTGPASEPVTIRPVPFKESGLPEYAKCKAWILDDVLSREECSELIAYAEASAPLEKPGDSPWKPALVSVAPGVEASAPNYRHSDRIIWDTQLLVDRLWDRCAQAEGLQELVATAPCPRPYRDRSKKGTWKFAGLNERMRFLKYGPGMFFRRHCDGAYSSEKPDGSIQETYYTLHLYLSDEGLVGGATAFSSLDKKRRMDVDPKAGSVLIFQHQLLYHEGAEVIEGLKYTMRTEIMYRWEDEPKAEGEN
ncbi:hypothetical protein M441DRAFT_58545 [Trichoderma asperellum CBS 433.97]|uniref:Prolyl 4-hydroxylase alpha subunit domain-containing protein n=1 Tax=Trichoderma asperellum (strain ATCC 204424 / CBS 433.97 / NBRC 101777) TaxID=1042311 RepID=A0A2T3Z8H2_TRIA4|nr:hypothetical protein M441DRAFT_58545 [Trichoderma asperellum CBS 433.97]PTB41107.1 hypothetical protein M441DRAFT_58545 [Trichoderma asperellum CBS 433.97]